MSQADDKSRESYPPDGEATRPKRGAAAPPPAGVEEEGNIDKIRDILFGTHMRNFEKRLGRTEERMSKEVADLGGETRKRLDQMESLFKKEVESLVDRLKNEQGTRTQSLNEISKELKETVKLFEKRFAQADDQSGKAMRDLRQQILDLSKSLSEDLRQRSQETLKALEAVARELRAEKVDRAAFSDLLAEMALRVKGDTPAASNPVKKDSK